MASMDITQRNQYERIDLTTPSTGVQVRHRGRLAALSVALAAVLAALVYATVIGIDEWSQLVVLGGIALTAIGAMIALDPLRRG